MNILIAALALLLLFLFVRWFLERAPKYGKAFLLRFVLVLLVVLFVWLALTGRLHWLLALLGTLLPFARRLLPILLRLFPVILQRRRHQQAGQKAGGQSSRVDTQWLQMTLDHDSGAMTGMIIGSAYIGRHLNDLSIDELKDFYDQCRQKDPDAIRLLDAYIHRHCAQEWESAQQPGQQAPASNNQAMTCSEAWAILGLEPGASREEVVKAHKRMILKVHPDRGGSNYLAAKINQAKDLLLKHP